MGQSLNQLLQFPTKEELREQMLYALQGVGFVLKTGIGTGAMYAYGVAVITANVRLRISTGGELGTGAFEVSLDGGTNYDAPVTLPASGMYIVPLTGATVLFSAGPEGIGTSFESGDFFDFELRIPNMPTAAWQPGSTQLTLAELMAEATENLAVAVRNIASGGFLRTARGPWLDLVMENQYSLPRTPARAAEGSVVLTDAGSNGPFTIQPGQVWVATPGGLRFNNVGGGTLALSGSLTLTFKAEKTGSIYNVGGGTITELLTSLPGVTVVNPNPVGGTWITSAGADRETDGAGIIRAEARWPELGIGSPNEAYDLWAKTVAEGAVTRTWVRASPTMPGYIDVYLAGPAGAVDAGTVTLVQDYVDPRASVVSVPVVASATGNNVTVGGMVYVRAGQLTAASLAISQNLTALFGGGVNSIGEELPGIPIGGQADAIVYRSELIEQIQVAAGVRNIDMSSLTPYEDVLLAPAEVAVLVQTLSLVEVA